MSDREDRTINKELNPEEILEGEPIRGKDARLNVAFVGSVAQRIREIALERGQSHTAIATALMQYGIEQHQKRRRDSSTPSSGS